MIPPSTPSPVLPARQEHLLAVLRQADDELSGQELHARLRAGEGAMGLATVYRHLGINSSDSFLDYGGRPMPILPFGDPISELIRA